MSETDSTLSEVAEAADKVDAPSPPNAVIVFVTYKDDGNVEVDPQVSGNVRITEAESLLGAARKLVGQRLGVA